VSKAARAIVKEKAIRKTRNRLWREYEATTKTLITSRDPGLAWISHNILAAICACCHELYEEAPMVTATNLKGRF